MTNLADLASSAVHAGKNIILTNTPGIGNITSITKRLKEDGFAVAMINLAYEDSNFRGFPLIREGKVEVRFPQTMLNADVIIFDQAESTTPTNINTVKELLNHHTVLGSEFPNLKSVIVVFTETRESANNISLGKDILNGISGGRVVNLVG